MKTVYLHIGRGKTGTSAIQSFLSRARSSLHDSGLHYLLAGDHQGNPGHHQFAKSFISTLPAYMDPPQHPEIIRQATYDEICATPLDTVLISSENFPLADIGEIARFFAGFPFEIKVRVIFFVRSHDELLESEYNQMVKLKREARSLLVYADQAFEGVDYYAEASAWERSFGRENLICRVYDGARNDVVDRFLSCLPGMDQRLTGKVGPNLATYANRSIGIKALHVARLLNSIEIDHRDALYRQMFSRFAESDLPAILFDADEAGRFRTGFAESNRQFSARYLGTAVTDLGGRRYSDPEREAMRAQIRALGLNS